MFCDDYIKDNPVSVCEHIVKGYVSHWDLKEIIRKPPFEDVDIDIDIHDLYIHMIMIVFMI